jgi:hypothetical protein
VSFLSSSAAFPSVIFHSERQLWFCAIFSDLSFDVQQFHKFIFVKIKKFQIYSARKKTTNFFSSKSIEAQHNQY